MAMRDNDISDLLADFEAKLREAFERGYRLGAVETRDKIMRAAGAMDAPAEGTQKEIPAPRSSLQDEEPKRVWPPGRVERGTVRRVLNEVMSETEGYRIAEIGERARMREPSVSPTSVPNELRRNEGTLYRKVGELWFKIGSETKTAGAATNDHPAAISQQRHGGAT